jgi:hypothetical protein
VMYVHVWLEPDQARLFSQVCLLQGPRRCHRDSPALTTPIRSN